MHEMGYCVGVLEAVEARADGRPVSRIGVRVGALHRVSPAAFEQSFQMIADGGVASGAAADVVIVPARASCADCAAVFETPDPAPMCPECHGAHVSIAGGDELILQWVEYAEPADAARMVRESAGTIRVSEHGHEHGHGHDHEREDR